MNTPKQGFVRCITFKDGDTWYSVALEFNIVESSDSSEISRINLQEAMKGYVETQHKIRGSRMAPLNQKTDKEYENLWKMLMSKKQPKAIPFQVSEYGFVTV
jgi:hypothetical protein